MSEISVLKSFLQKIFSVKINVRKNIRHKVITILGLKLKIKLKTTEKEDYKKIYEKYQKKHKKIIKNLKKASKARKIRVCFLVNETAKWNAERLYEKMEKSDIFEPFVIVTNLKKTGERQSYKHLLEYFKSCVKNVKIGWDEEKKQGIDLKIFKPDIIFFQQPWELYENQNAEYISDFALPYYFSYAVSDLYLVMKRHLTDFYLVLQKNFIFSQAEKELYSKMYNYNWQNLSVTGHPKLDTYKDYREENYKRHSVIYAPHHSLEFNSLNYSTFTWNSKYMLEWAKNHPEFDWIFKPHPRLKYALILNNIMTEDEAEQYYEEWRKIGLCYEDGSYFDLFKNSKCLITDCDSFLTEYLPTKQPIIHLRNPKAKEYMISNTIIMNSLYDVWNLEELENTLNKVLIKEIDEKRNDRIEMLDKLNITPGNSAQKILDAVMQDIGLK